MSVQSAKEDVDNASTIRRMKKLLPSVRALRNQFEPRSGAADDNLVKTTLNNKESMPRKWKSTSNFQTVIKDPATASSKRAMLMERSTNNRSRSNSLGSLTDEMSSSTSSSSKTSTSIQQPAVMMSEDYSVSTVSIIQQVSDKDFDMYRPRHSTAQWDPVRT